MSRARGVDALLTQQMGLDPSTVGSSLISRGLQARMSELGLGDQDEYERVLRGSREELQNLIEEIVVPESWFFRDDRPFGFLREHVEARWLANPGARPLRALSLPCAGGEEPYSIAMAFLDRAAWTAPGAGFTAATPSGSATCRSATATSTSTGESMSSTPPCGTGCG
jgi:chemotaxis protein methyltransferase WspC